MLEVVALFGGCMVLAYIYLTLRYADKDERFRMINAKSHVIGMSLLLLVNLIVVVLNSRNVLSSTFMLGFFTALAVVCTGYVLAFYYYSRVM